MAKNTLTGTITASGISIQIFGQSSRYPWFGLPSAFFAIPRAIAIRMLYLQDWQTFRRCPLVCRVEWGIYERLSVSPTDLIEAVGSSWRLRTRGNDSRIRRRLGVIDEIASANTDQRVGANYGAFDRGTQPYSPHISYETDERNSTGLGGSSLGRTFDLSLGPMVSKCCHFYYCDDPAVGLVGMNDVS